MVQRAGGGIEEPRAKGGKAGGAGGKQPQRPIGAVGLAETDDAASGLIAVRGPKAGADTGGRVGQAEPAGQSGQSEAAALAARRRRQREIKGIRQGAGNAVNGHRVRGIDGSRAGIRQGVEVLSIDGA